MTAEDVQKAEKRAWRTVPMSFSQTKTEYQRAQEAKDAQAEAVLKAAADT